MRLLLHGCLWKIFRRSYPDFHLEDELLLQGGEML